ncbi:hypothetical protein [Demequina muriae]|uniref:Uncharacterized protein n=1 Tax=Demequina muriae TaxID=3051664 RepID=A0ABT8GDC2_9MICO|nr:hypothetical protein [Demequina sp. EGI L300058]MDN4479420.1 hypothetical protein [Demequina sp. EGI L300058]
MYLQDPVSLMALHRADHRELVADAQYARRRRARRSRLVRRAYVRAVRRMRAARSVLTLSSRVAP